MTQEALFPEGTPEDRPNVARLYDYLLGGFHNFEVDRLTAEKLLQVYPEMRVVAAVNRSFLRRAVHFLAEQGIDQFLDIGSGIPTAGNVHEVAQQVNPAARVVYVDIDPIAVAHSKAILQGNPNAVAIRADARQPEEILGHAEVRRMIDFHRPLAVLLVAVLHILTDDSQAMHTVRVLRDAVPPGSYLALSHPCIDAMTPEMVSHMRRVTVTPQGYKYRPREVIERYFDGLEPVEPGLVYTPLWRPEGPDDFLLDDPQSSYCLAGIGRKA